MTMIKDTLDYLKSIAYDYGDKPNLTEGEIDSVIDDLKIIIDELTMHRDIIEIETLMTEVVNLNPHNDLDDYPPND